VVLTVYGVLHTVAIVLGALDRLELDDPLDTRSLRWRTSL
jgi:hypothetical protein